MSNWMTDKPTSTLEAIDELPESGHCSGEASITIVCISDLFWDEHWSSEQQLTSRLSKRCRVVYVERPVSVLSSFTGVSDASVFRQWWRWLTGGLRYENKNLAIVTPAPVLPCRYKRAVSKINAWLLRQSVKRALSLTGWKADVLWIYSPDTGDLVGQFGETFSLYYCADDWSASQQWWNNSGNILARESELASRVDLIIGTSTKIEKRWQESHHSTMLMTNGADVDAFQIARDEDLETPRDLVNIAGPRIGYVGCIDSRFDSDMYLRLARRCPDLQFVVVGPVTGTTANVTQLKELPNVHFLGPRARTELPAYLKGFDVCTIPYVCDKLAESIFPLKLFEYLSAGRPVVSTALPELTRFKNYIHVTLSEKDFEMAIRDSLTNPLSRPSESFLAKHSWQAKADSLWETLLNAVHSGVGQRRRNCE